ncbi:hypothetical protein MPSYJ_18690 [Mycolicibacterium psychrotolerans]|uniref:Uncharacterized protein n=1 Tax=Mycolicibacterium psychrotolerans TaxID=216929 RepID=A0A7I7M852_9MYCO|nr:hypothetical protein MPSYJ_18690 [Mycolicibacterium psychrotolerans]
MPGIPDLRIRSPASSSSLATASSTAFSGRGIAGTSGGGVSPAWSAVDGEVEGWDEDGVEPAPHPTTSTVSIASAATRGFMVER